MRAKAVKHKLHFSSYVRLSEEEKNGETTEIARNTNRQAERKNVQDKNAVKMKMTQNKSLTADPVMIWTGAPGLV